MTKFQRQFLYASTLAAAASGLVYFWMKRMMEPTDPWAVINHPLEPWALKAHILTAPLMLFAVGLIGSQHIWRSFRSKLPTGRRSGVLATATFAPLALGGYLIQVATAPLAVEILAWTHLVLGLGCAWALAAHRRVLRPRRLRRRPGALPVLQLDGAMAGEAPSETASGAASVAAPDRPEEAGGGAGPAAARRPSAAAASRRGVRSGSA